VVTVVTVNSTRFGGHPTLPTRQNTPRHPHLVQPTPTTAPEDHITTPTTLAPTDELLTIEDAATRLHMSARYVRRLVAERRIAFHRFGRSVRIDPADLAAHIQAGRVEPITYDTVWRDLRRAA